MSITKFFMSIPKFFLGTQDKQFAIIREDTDQTITLESLIACYTQSQQIESSLMEEDHHGENHWENWENHWEKLAPNPRDTKSKIDHIIEDILFIHSGINRLLDSKLHTLKNKLTPLEQAEYKMAGVIKFLNDRCLIKDCLSELDRCISVHSHTTTLRKKMWPALTQKLQERGSLHILHERKLHSIKRRLFLCDSALEKGTPFALQHMDESIEQWQIEAALHKDVTLSIQEILTVSDTEINAKWCHLRDKATKSIHGLRTGRWVEIFGKDINTQKNLQSVICYPIMNCLEDDLFEQKGNIVWFKYSIKKYQELVTDNVSQNTKFNQHREDLLKLQKINEATRSIFYQIKIWLQEQKQGEI